MKKLNFWKILLIILIIVFIYNVIDNGIEIYNDYEGKNLLFNHNNTITGKYKLLIK